MPAPCVFLCEPSLYQVLALQGILVRVLLFSGSCDCLVQMRGQVLGGHSDPAAEGDLRGGLFVLCPSKLTGNAAQCPWPAPVCVWVMQQIHGT